MAYDAAGRIPLSATPRRFRCRRGRRCAPPGAALGSVRQGAASGAAAVFVGACLGGVGACLGGVGACLGGVPWLGRALVGLGRFLGACLGVESAVSAGAFRLELDRALTQSRRARRRRRNRRRRPCSGTLRRRRRLWRRRRRRPTSRGASARGCAPGWRRRRRRRRVAAMGRKWRGRRQSRWCGSYASRC